MKKEKRNYSLNILKGVCCILIVFNHCKFPGITGNLIENYARIGVPVFFMISGFFVSNNDKLKVNKKIVKTMMMLIYSCLFWLIYNILRFYFIDNAQLFTYLNNLINIKTIGKFILLNENPFWGHLWFINALLYCYIYQYIIIKFNKQKKVEIIEKVLAICLLIFYIIINIIIIKDDLSNIYLIRNFIFMGIPFFCIGKHINVNKIYFEKIKILIIIVLFILLNIEILLYRSELYISSIFLSIYLFKLCLKNPNNYNKLLDYIGDKISMYVYILHPAIKYVVIYLFKLLKIHSGVILYIEPLVMLILTLITSHIYRIVLLKMQNRYKKIKLLKTS